jgi:hypothetical protein
VPVACRPGEGATTYIRTTDGVDLYFEWADIGYQDGWLVKSYAPDVG